MNTKFKLNEKAMFKLPDIIIVDGKRYENQTGSHYIGLGNDKVFNVDTIKNTLLKMIDNGKYALIQSTYDLIEEIDIHNNSIFVEVKIYDLTSDTKKIIFQDLYHPIKPYYMIRNEKYKSIYYNISAEDQHIVVQKCA